ncbi:hypothetical protein HDG33_004769 [Paraburkholderia sp. Cpub6]|nr:hypothetical protein [Paraburkholderia sp. Cpub6]
MENAPILGSLDNISPGREKDDQRIATMTAL